MSTKKYKKPMYRKCIYCLAPAFSDKSTYCSKECYDKHLALKGKCLMDGCSRAKSLIYKDFDFCSKECYHKHQKINNI